MRNQRPRDDIGILKNVQYYHLHELGALPATIDKGGEGLETEANHVTFHAENV
jgi:hypothetical protein